MITIEIFKDGEMHDRIEKKNEHEAEPFLKMTLKKIGRPENTYIDVKGMYDHESPLTDKDIDDLKQKLHKKLIA